MVFSPSNAPEVVCQTNSFLSNCELRPKGGFVRIADLGVTLNMSPQALLNPVDFSLHEAPVLQHACIFALFAHMYAPVAPE